MTTRKARQIRLNCWILTNPVLDSSQFTKERYIFFQSYASFCFMVSRNLAWEVFSGRIEWLTDTESCDVQGEAPREVNWVDGRCSHALAFNVLWRLSWWLYLPGILFVIVLSRVRDRWLSAGVLTRLSYIFCGRFGNYSGKSLELEPRLERAGELALYLIDDVRPIDSWDKVCDLFIYFSI